MEILKTDDDLVLKFVHDDTSETAIKFVSSCDTIVNPITGAVEYNNIDRNKVSVFISASAGCPMKCKFCHLTLKDMAFGKLNRGQITSNIKEAMLYAKDQLKGKYLKLCWMGMGEAIFQPTVMAAVTHDITRWALTEEELCEGIDGIDVATVLPKVKSPEAIVDMLEGLNGAYTRHNMYPLNPNNKNVVHVEKNSNFATEYENRSIVRLFYSLHSAIQTTRDIIIPNAMPINAALYHLDKLDSVDLIFHHMFLDGLNDSDEEVEKLIELFRNRSDEIRILRFNGCGYHFEESRRFDEIITKLIDAKLNLKVQISTGREISAACGQFLTPIVGEM